MSQPPPPLPVEIRCRRGGNKACVNCKCSGSAIDQKAVDARGGDPNWWLAHSELGVLHATKADGYGSDDDALANYVLTSEKWGDCDEATPARRIDEKMTRARNLILAGRADEVEEWMDIAALALGAEALRRRRLV